MSEKYELLDLSDFAGGERHDALCSLQDRVKQLECDWPLTERTRSNLSRALESLDLEAREAFIRKHRGRLENIDQLNSLKYSDFVYWARRNALIAEWLDLDNSPPLSILDIGAGPGRLVEDLLQSKGQIFILMPLDKDDAGNLSYSPLLEWSRQRGARVATTFPSKPVKHIHFLEATEKTFDQEAPVLATNQRTMS